MRNVNLTVLGATGAVGTDMLKILAERSFPVGNLKLLADKKDAGKEITFNGKSYTVEEATNDSFEGADIVLVAVPDSLSKIFSPEAVKRGAIVIDNSSAYRMDENVPLVIPEINPEDVDWNKGIIANPNCSTIIGLMATYAINNFSRIKRFTASTYQAVSGAGIAGIGELKNQSMQVLNGESVKPEAFLHQIAFNLIPHIDSFTENGYTKEEMKLTNEGRKIFHDPQMKIASTCVRVPVFRSHSESITIETEQKVTVAKAMELLKNAPGVKLVDDPANGMYPMPADTSGQDLVYVGRIREDISAENSLTLWCCGDQIRKGAATNAIQIAELLIKRGLIK